MLAYDTDIDLMFLGKGTRSARYGADISRNLTSNLEVHGEVALVTNAERRVLGSNDSVTSTGGDAMNWLVGLRYLTETDTTYIAEYYRNGVGFTGEEGEDFFGFSREAADAYAQTGATSELDRARSLSNGGFGRPNAFRDYLYFRASQKDPWDILYLTPAFTVIANLHDRSFMAMPEVLYTGITNWEFRLRASANLGGTGSEYGEKQSAAKLELRIRRYF